MIAEKHTQSKNLPFKINRKLLLAAIVFTSLFVHAWAIYRLPEDPDEPVYMSAAYGYADAIRAGDLERVVNYEGNRESPPLVKLIYSIPFLTGKFAQDSRWPLLFARSVSALFGTLTILLAALVDPVAGILLLFHSVFTKYTSLAMIDALPVFTSLTAVLALDRYHEKNRHWLWFSAAALGLALAGKYTFAVVLVPILVIFFTRRVISFKKIILYGLVALFVFWAVNPTFWADPIRQILFTIRFHNAYSHGADVVRANFPWYQPFIWLTTPVRLHPGIFFYPYLDLFVSAAALTGLYFESKQRLWLVVWIIAGVIILLAWPTKWPHYTLMISAPLCLAAASMIRKVLAWFFMCRQ